MSRREDYENRTQALLEPIARANGVSIYDVEYIKEGADYHLCAYIDKPEGVNIQDCENVSRALSDALDREDFIADAYVLEVSSPGLGRALKKDKHLQAALGEDVLYVGGSVNFGNLEIVYVGEEECAGSEKAE